MSTNLDKPEQEPSEHPQIDQGDNGDGANSAETDAQGTLIPVLVDMLERLPPDALSSLPPDVRSRLESQIRSRTTQIFSATSLSMAPGRTVNPVTSQIGPQHITEIINQRGRSSDQEHNFKKWLLVFAGFIVLVLSGIIVFMTINERPDLVREIISGFGGLLIGLVGGIGSGYGYARRRR